MHVQNPSAQPLPWQPYMTIWTCLAHKIMLMAIFIWYAFCIKVQKRPRKPFFSVGPNIGLTPKLMWFLLKVDMRQLGHPSHLLELVFSSFSSYMALWVQGSLDFFWHERLLHTGTALSLRERHMCSSSSSSWSLQVNGHCGKLMLWYPFCCSSCPLWGSDTFQHRVQFITESYFCPRLTTSQNSSLGCMFHCHASLIWPFYTKIQRHRPNKVAPCLLLKVKDFFSHFPKLRCHLTHVLWFGPCGSARPLQ